MLYIVAIAVIVIAIVFWTVSTKRLLSTLNKNIDNAMQQVGIQLSSQFNLLVSLLNLTYDYEPVKVQELIDGVKLYRSEITEKSTPQDVITQENIIAEMLNQIAIIAEQHSSLKADEDYGKTLGAINQYEKMVRTSHLIYNESVTSLNFSLRMLPTSLFAKILGFHKLDYLEIPENLI
ncbi:MAG: LemA family protein [Christensenellaceae bacterium]